MEHRARHRRCSSSSQATPTRHGGRGHHAAEEEVKRIERESYKRTDDRTAECSRSERAEDPWSKRCCLSDSTAFSAAVRDPRRPSSLRLVAPRPVSAALVAFRPFPSLEFYRRRSPRSAPLSASSEPSHTVPRHAKPRRATPSHAEPRRDHAEPRHAMPCHANPRLMRPLLPTVCTTTVRLLLASLDPFSLAPALFNSIARLSNPFFRVQHPPSVFLFSSCSLPSSPSSPSSSSSSATSCSSLATTPPQPPPSRDRKSVV